MPAERYVEVLAELKPTFIHHQRAKELIAGLLSEVGADIERTYFDVPRLRTMAHGEYLNAGLAYQFHSHRDTWFSAPMQQLNWWLPVYGIESENSMTDANAKRIVQRILDADADEQRLRERTNKAMLAALPARKAARYLQIENKIRAINRYDLAERMPLVK